MTVAARRAAVVPAMLLLGALPGCTESATSSASATASPFVQASRPPAATAVAANPLDACPEVRDLATVTPLARLSGEPDDLAVTADGHIWVSLHAAGRLVELDRSANMVASLADAQGPEGIVVLADGRLAVAEQQPNRIDIVDAASGARTPLITLPGESGEGVGVDGLGIDLSGSHLLVPDSPAGTLLLVPLSGGRATTLATGLGRPVSAAMLTDSSVLVAVENEPGLVRVGLQGRVVPVVAAGALESVDEVLVHRGLAYVTDLVAGTLAAVDPSTGKLRVLVRGSPAPQGLAITPDGRLLLVDSSRGVIASVPACS